MGDQLLPCPFCGEKTAFDQWPCDWIDGSGRNVVRCAVCHGSAPTKVWNRRALSARAAVPEGWRLVPNDGLCPVCRYAYRSQACADANHPDPLLAAAPQPAGEVVPRPDLVPGVMRCAKCAFQLHRVTLCVRNGTTGAGDSDTEPCPNGCGPLWPVTWRQWAEEAQEYAERLRDELDALKAEPAPSAPADVEALATEIAAYYDGKPSCPAEAELQGFEDYPPSWRFSAEKLHEFARRLSDAQQVEARVVGWMHEDELPEGYPYDAMFPHSRVDGVRLFPVYAPAQQAAKDGAE